MDECRFERYPAKLSHACMQYSQCVTDNGKSNRVNAVAKTSAKAPFNK